MNSIEDAIRQIIVERLELPIAPEEIDVTAPLIGSPTAGGLGLDSLSSLDILAGLSEHFGLPMDDIESNDFRSVTSLADYLRRQGVEG